MRKGQLASWNQLKLDCVGFILESTEPSIPLLLYIMIYSDQSLSSISPLPSLPPSLPPSRPGTFPMDTTKTRLQIQGQKTSIDRLCRQTRYRGMTHALLRISQEEGLRALYNGYAYVGALLRAMLGCTFV